MVKSSYDYLFAKPSLRWLFGDYMPPPGKSFAAAAAAAACHAPLRRLRAVITERGWRCLQVACAACST
jgi:hypothetical protein